MSDKLQRINESIERRVDEWHNSDCPLTLAEYLGWTPGEYVEWLEERKIPIRELNRLS
jgi:hypothetical protein